MNKFFTSAVAIGILASTISSFNAYAASGDTSSDAALDSVINGLLDSSATPTTTATPTATTTSTATDTSTTGTDLDAISAQDAMVEPTSDNTTSTTTDPLVVDDSVTTGSTTNSDVMVEPTDATTSTNTAGGTETSVSGEAVANNSSVVATPRNSSSVRRLSSAGMEEFAMFGAALLASIGFVAFRRKQKNV